MTTKVRDVRNSGFANSPGTQALLSLGSVVPARLCPHIRRRALEAAEGGRARRTAAVPQGRVSEIAHNVAARSPGSTQGPTQMKADGERRPVTNCCCRKGNVKLPPDLLSSRPPVWRRGSGGDRDTQGPVPSSTTRPSQSKPLSSLPCLHPHKCIHNTRQRDPWSSGTRAPQSPSSQRQTAKSGVNKHVNQQDVVLQDRSCTARGQPCPLPSHLTSYKV